MNEAEQLGSGDGRGRGRARVDGEGQVHSKCGKRYQASVLMLRLSYPTETVLSNKITRNRIVLSFKDSPRKPLGRRPKM